MSLALVWSSAASAHVPSLRNHSQPSSHLFLKGQRRKEAEKENGGAAGGGEEGGEWSERTMRCTAL
eukprot:6690189-Pyramimonas_sp.AAC.1